MKPGRPTTLVAEARSSARSGRAARPRTRTRRSRSPEPRPRSRPSRFRRSPTRTPPRRRGGRRRRDRAASRTPIKRPPCQTRSCSRRASSSTRSTSATGTGVARRRTSSGSTSRTSSAGDYDPTTPEAKAAGGPRRPSPSRPRRDERVRVGGPAAAHPHRSSSYAPAALSRANRSSTTCGQLLTKPVASTAVTMSDGFLPVSNASGNGDARLIRLK